MGRLSWIKNDTIRVFLYIYVFICPLNVPHKKQNAHILLEMSVLSKIDCTQSRDRTGMEVNPLVFETSASTNSAIWASLKVSAKVIIIFRFPKSEGYFFISRCIFYSHTTLGWLANNNTKPTKLLWISWFFVSLIIILLL